MTESPNNNSLMQKLLAERHAIKGYNDLIATTNSISSCRPDLVVAPSLTRDAAASSAIDSAYSSNSGTLLERSQKNQSAYSHFAPQDEGPAARLDALCRSTLDKSSSGFAKSGNSNATNSPTVKGEPKPLLKGTNTRSASREVLMRLRKEFEASETTPRCLPTYQEVKADQVKMPQLGCCDSSNALISPRYASLDSYKAKSTMVSRSFPLLDSNQSRKNPTGPEFHLNGHPKSNSGGDEYLYTDHLRISNNQRRGIRSKKNKNGVGRSSSLRQTPEETIQDSSSSEAIPPTPNSLINKIAHGPPVNGLITSVYSVHPKHASSRSAPLQDSEESIYVEKRRASLHGTLHRLAEDRQTNLSDFSQDQLQQNQTQLRVSCVFDWYLFLLLLFCFVEFSRQHCCFC